MEKYSSDSESQNFTSSPKYLLSFGAAIVTANRNIRMAEIGGTKALDLCSKRLFGPKALLSIPNAASAIISIVNFETTV